MLAAASTPTAARPEVDTSAGALLAMAPQSLVQHEALAMASRVAEHSDIQTAFATGRDLLRASSASLRAADRNADQAVQRWQSGEGGQD